jgi:hypothetical protein
VQALARERIGDGDKPAIGGKSTASIPRKRSPHDMMMMVCLSVYVVFAGMRVRIEFRQESEREADLDIFAVNKNSTRKAGA